MNKFLCNSHLFIGVCDLSISEYGDTAQNQVDALTDYCGLGLWCTWSCLTTRECCQEHQSGLYLRANKHTHTMRTYADMVSPFCFIETALSQ